LTDSVEIVACSWKCLQAGIERIIDHANPQFLVVTDYPDWSTDKSLLECIRVNHPEVEVFSVLESGAITVELDRGTRRIVPTIPTPIGETN
jgi:hypothetical protein